MEVDRTLYDKWIQERSSIHYLIGLFVRWKMNVKYERARQIARKNGAQIGDGVVMSITLAKK